MKTDAWLSGLPFPDPDTGTPTLSDGWPLFDERVMLVDDEPLMTDLVQTHLEDAGYSRFVVTNEPAKAMALMREHDPGVVLLDLLMPGISGFELLQQIRADPLLRYTPVIVLTSATSAETKLKALNLGATDFLAKPVNESELVLRVRNTLAFRQYNRRLLFFDQATGLPNRRLFERTVAGQLAAALRDDAMTVVFSVGVVEYRQVLETLGRAAADQLALALGTRLARLAEPKPRALLRATEPELKLSVARLSGEHFGVVASGLKAIDCVERVAKQIVDDIALPVVVDGHEVAPSAGVGISIGPADSDRSETLIMQAELAGSQALQRGISRYEFFSQALNERSLQRLLLGAQLRHAAARNELRLHYQPVVDATSNRIVGVEALLRWQHPDLGLLQPDRFIPLAEELGLIGDLGHWVVRTACAEVMNWTLEGLPPVKVSINVSRVQFDGRRLETDLKQALQESGLPPGRLVIELTESMLLDDAPAALALMHRLKVIGVGLSIDDFGTGYSSLSYLRSIPVDELKIDRSFVAELTAGNASLAIARTIVALGHNLGMTVVAEGVETPAQLTALRMIACDQYQGFHFSPPVEPPELLELLRASMS